MFFAETNGQTATKRLAKQSEEKLCAMIVLTRTELKAERKLNIIAEIEARLFEGNWVESNTTLMSLNINILKIYISVQCNSSGSWHLIESGKLISSGE